mmetsp:Transcript_56742/g.63434  ORF Transcript_56742/g.63434 Transcript_56742/m.63434 type:complete len:183 (+) Transcript_56742:44-592(+)
MKNMPSTMHDYNNDNDITRRIKKSRIGGVEDDREEKYPSSPSQWWFSRHYLSTLVAVKSSGILSPQSSIVSAITPSRSTVTGSDTNILSGMILNENLGITSDVIESLTHDVSNWSLTRIQVSLPPPSITTTSTNTNITTHTNISNHSEKIKLKQRCKDAQHQVRRAQRCFTEEQQKLFLLHG